MEISCIKKFPFPGSYPSFPIDALTFGTMTITATVIADAYMGAIVTLVHMPAESCCPAFLDGIEYRKMLL